MLQSIYEDRERPYTYQVDVCDELPASAGPLRGHVKETPLLHGGIVAVDVDEVAEQAEVAEQSVGSLVAFAVVVRTERKRRGRKEAGNSVYTELGLHLGLHDCIPR